MPTVRWLSFLRDVSRKNESCVLPHSVQKAGLNFFAPDAGAVGSGLVVPVALAGVALFALIVGMAEGGVARTVVGCTA